MDAEGVDVETFLAEYLNNWRVPRHSLGSIFHPEGRLRVPGQAEALTPDEATAMIARTKELVPDVSIEILRWAERHGDLFTEWEMTGTFEGRALRWGGINRNTLRGAHSVDAVSHWDRQSLNDQLAAGTSTGDALGRVLER